MTRLSTGTCAGLLSRGRLAAGRWCVSGLPPAILLLRRASGSAPGGRSAGILAGRVRRCVRNCPLPGGSARGFLPASACRGRRLLPRAAGLAGSSCSGLLLRCRCPTRGSARLRRVSCATGTCRLRRRGIVRRCFTGFDGGGRRLTRPSCQFSSSWAKDLLRSRAVPRGAASRGDRHGNDS